MRTESAEEFTSSARRPAASVSESAAAAGKWTVKLGCYAVATVAFTFMLLRPRRAGAGNRGSLFLGSGVIVVLIKTLLSTSEGSSATPVPVTPVLAAATPAPVAPVQAAAAPAAPARRRPANQATVSQPKSGAVTDAHPKKPAPASGTTVAGASNASDPAKPKPAAPVKPAAAPTKSQSPLGPRYADKQVGYSVQFPAGWTHRPFQEGGCWVLDASDGQAAISVGFSKFPATMSVDEVIPEKVSRGLQKRAGTVVHGTGYATIGGRRSLWHKYTGPIARPNGNTRMTVVHYLLPLRDGRALELRLAAVPEKFNEAAPRMKLSIDSFKLLPRQGEGGTARAK